VAERWAQYSGGGWRPIRLGTRGLWAGLAALGVVGVARATGGAVLRLPLLALVPLRFLALVLFRPRLEPSTSHGSARWAPWWTRLGVRLRRGRAQLALGRSWIGPLPITIGIPEEEQFYHAVLVAPPGAGKTSRVLIPNILRECLRCRPTEGRAERGDAWRDRWRNLGHRPPPPRSFVAADPKGELVRATSRAARRGHDVYLLDFLHPERSHRWNPLANVRTALDADLLAETIVANTGRGKEPFWEQLAHGLIAAAALHLARTAEGWPPTLAELCALLLQQSPDAVLATFTESPVPEVRAGAAQLREAMRDNERMKGAAFADLQNRLRRLNHPEIAATTADNEINLAAFGQRPIALYIRFDQNRTELLAPLTALFYAQLFDTLMAQAAANPGGRLAVPTMFYLEEFGNIGVLPGVERKMNQLRSYGVGFFLVLQNLAQLDDLYGEAVAGAIFESCWTRLCLAGVGTATGTAFSALAGAATTLTASQGFTRAITRLPWADSGSRGSAEAARPLLTPDELRTMGDRLLAVMGRRPPLLVRTRPWYRDPLLRGLVPRPADGDPLADDFRRGEPGGAGAPPPVVSPPAPVVAPGPSRDEQRATAIRPDGAGLSRRDAPAGWDAPARSAAPTDSLAVAPTGHLPAAPAAPPALESQPGGGPGRAGGGWSPRRGDQRDRAGAGERAGAPSGAPGARRDPGEARPGAVG
jgi:type IV secretory pathway TraG/TraD family ATPase VirD4